MIKFLRAIIFVSLLFTDVGCQSLWREVLTVAKDGSGNFTTIQAAVNAIRGLSQVQVMIYIKAGLYNEKLIIPAWKPKISLIGEDKLTTIISNGDYRGKHLPGTCVDPVGNDQVITFTSYTVLVQGKDFEASNLTIQNTAGNVGQAVALHVEADRVIVRNCNILGNQDTIYAASEGSRQYYKDCNIEGTTDFIFGEATSLFENCTIKSLQNSYITAAATPRNQKYGFVFQNCTLTAGNSNVTRVYLGRPWGPWAKTVFLHTKMGTHILPAGWHNWDNNAGNEGTAYYAEYQTEGVDVKDRVPWSKQLTKDAAAKYTKSNIFAGGTPWIFE